MVAIGGPFFVRFALLPAAGRVLDGESHEKLREAVNARWRIVVHVAITLFLITGLYNFLVETRVDGVLVTARWKEMSPPDKRLYHMLFGIKVLAAFAMFTIASGLAGRTATFAPMRKNARLFLSVLLVCAVVVLGCATTMRYLPSSGRPPYDPPGPAAGSVPPPATAP